MFSERKSRGKHGNGANYGIRKDRNLKFAGGSRPRTEKQQHQRPTGFTVSRRTTADNSHNYDYYVGNSHQIWVQKQTTHLHDHPTDFRAGNRGTTRLQWRRGLREPPEFNGGRQHGTPTTVFIDNLHQNMAKEWLWDVFSEYGKVEDIFISKKVRKSKRDAFGFVRYKKKHGALEAIKYLNGREVKGKKMVVSMAKYYKGGEPIKRSVAMENDIRIKSPAFRDGRRYVEVVKGKQGEQSCEQHIQINGVEQNVNRKGKGKAIHSMGQNTKAAVHRLNREDVVADGYGKRYSGSRDTTKKANGCGLNNVMETRNTTHNITLNVAGNVTVAEKLKMAVVVDCDVLISPTQAADWVVEANVNCVYFSSLTSFSYVLFFESIVDVNNALDNMSPLWKYFKCVRRWSEEIEYKDRLACLECYGIHPTCWELENIKKIGELWGTVLHVDNDISGVNNLTYARLLVRTEAHFRVDTQIKLAWENGKCDIWVKESESGCGNSVLGKNQLIEEEEEEDAHEQTEQQHSISKSWVSETNDSTMKQFDHCEQNLSAAIVEMVDPILLDILNKPMSSALTQSRNAKEWTLHPEHWTHQFAAGRPPISLPSTQLSEEHQRDSSTQQLSDDLGTMEIKSCQLRKEWCSLDNSDPIILERLLVSAPDHFDQHFDPMQTHDLATPIAAPQQNNDIEVMTDAPSRKTRGRPKKKLRDFEKESTLTPWNGEEAQSTWSTVKKLGVSSKSEHSMVSKIRKSKRLLQMGELST
ncbi:unnamed protein product [Amaranthus hypochondriacus]